MIPRYGPIVLTQKTASKECSPGYYQEKHAILIDFLTLALITEARFPISLSGFSQHMQSVLLIAIHPSQRLWGEQGERG